MAGPGWQFVRQITGGVRIKAEITEKEVIISAVKDMIVEFIDKQIDPEKQKDKPAPENPQPPKNKDKSTPN